MSQVAWKPPTTQNRWRWWLVHRAAPMVAFLAVMGILGWLLLQPFYHPQVYLLFAEAEYPPALLMPHSAPGENLAAILVPPIKLVTLPGAGEGDAARGLATPAALDTLLDRLDHYDLQGSDVLVAWIGAELLENGDEIELLCGNFDPMDPHAGRYPLSRLLARLSECPARTKVLLLDSCRATHLPRLGLLADCSAARVRELVQATKDSGLWVLASHDDLEPSFTIAEPYRSAFAHFIGEGLQGMADSDGDRFVNVGELFRATRSRLAEWIGSETGGQGSQTVMLHWGGGRPSPGMSYPVIQPVMPKKIEKLVSDGKQPASNAAAEPVLPRLWRPPSKFAATVPAAGPTPKTGEAKSEAAADKASDKVTSDPVLAAKAEDLPGMAWSLHDRLVASPDFRLIDDAPHYWRALQDRILILQAAIHSADKGRSTAAVADLRRLVRQLTDLGNGRTPSRYQEHDLVVAMSQAANAPAVDTALPSLAMAERLMRPLPADLAAAAADLDATIAGKAIRPDSAGPVAVLAKAGTAAQVKPAGGDFRKWVAELPPRYRDLAEFELARRLEEAPDLDPSGIQIALKTRRLAERVATATLDSGPWIRIDVDRADRLRLAGERGLIAAIRPTEAIESREVLQRAIGEYEKAMEESRDVVALERLVNDALYCLPDYLRWLIKSIPDADAATPDLASLEKWISAIRQAVTLLDHPAPESLADVRRLRNEMATMQDSVRTRVMAEHRAARLALSQGVNAADLRLRLDELPDWSKIGAGMGDTAAASKATRNTSDRLRRAAALYAATIEFLLGEARPGDKEAFALVAAGKFDDPKVDAAQLSRTCTCYGNALGEFLRGLPEAIQRVAAVNEDTTDPARRARQLQKLAQARRLLYLVHPWDADRMEASGPSQLLRRAELYDLLAWQEHRLGAAIADASPGELQALVESADAVYRSATSIAGQPAIAAVSRPGIEIELPARLDLAGESQREFAVSVTNRHEREADIWLTADYDPSAVSVQARDQARLYDAASVSPPLDTSAPTCRLQPGETKSVWVQVHRLSASGGDARIAFRAIGRSERVRRDLIAAVPGRLPVDLVADGIADTWRSQDSVLTLYPFPNRATSYTLCLANAAETERSVGFEIVRTDSRLDTLPQGDVAGDIAEKYLHSLSHLESVLRIEKIALAGGGRRVPIPFVPLVPVPPKAQTPAPDGAPRAAAAEKEKLPSLAGNLLAIITDHATGRRVFKRIEIFAQRPARYVRPWVEYDAERRRVEIVVKPVSPAAVPPDGVWIEAQPEEGEAVEPRRRSGAWLRPPAAEATVHVEVPRDAGAMFPVLLNVDGFDRAFRYEVPATATTRTLVPESGRVAARIRQPAAGTCYGPQTAEVPVSLEVDAPHGLLLDGGSFVEVGIDTNRDRELRHKETVRLTSDRQVELLLESVATDGTFVVRNKVSDLRVSLPPPKLKSMRANLLARVSLAGRDVWSEPVEVIFDDEPPRVSHLDLLPGTSVPQGKDLELSVLATDHELSGVAKVEAAFDMLRKGEFADPPPLPAVLQPDGRWSVTFPTKPLRPGKYGLLVRATDRLGNVSEYLKSSVEIVPAETEAVKRAVLGRIEGYVVYGRFEKRPVADVTVHLVEAKGGRGIRDATSDGEGHFSLADVPPGEYKLSAEKLIAGNRRTAQLDFKVPTPPAVAEPAELILSLPR